MNRALFLSCSVAALVHCSSMPPPACECPSMSPSVTVTVRDAVTNDLVASPAFTLDGNPITVGCAVFEIDDAGVDATPDASAPRCEQWRVTLPVGHSTLGVSALGYQPQSFAYDTQMSGGCCSTGTQLTQSVALTQ